MKIIDRAIMCFFDMVHRCSLFLDARERAAVKEARKKIVTKRLGLHKRYLNDKEIKETNILKERRVCDIDEACSLLYNEAHAASGEQNPVIVDFKYTDKPNFKITIEWIPFHPSCKD